MKDGEQAKRADGSAASQLALPRGQTGSASKMLYAMGAGGEVVANVGGRAVEDHPGQRRAVHHSSMLAGGDVAHAGHIGLNNGEVNYLDDDSGHYRPGRGAHQGGVR